MFPFDLAWALLKSDDFYEAFEGQNPNNPTMQEALRMQQEKEFTDAFEPSGPRVIPESEYNPYDRSMRRILSHRGPSPTSSHLPNPEVGGYQPPFVVAYGGQMPQRPIDVYRERQPTGNENDFYRFLMNYYMNPPATERRRTARTVQEIMDDVNSYYE